MPESAAGQNTVLPKITRIRDDARAVLDRLDRGDALSAVLSQAKAVVDDYGSRIHSFWLEFEIYGLTDVPLVDIPFTDRDRKTAGYLVAKLHSASDPKQVTIESAYRQWEEGGEDLPDRDKIILSSIFETENALLSWEQYEKTLTPLDWASPSANHLLQLNLLNADRRRILNGVRAYLYDYIAGINRWAVAECENQALLGPDYRIVVDSLDALQSGVGQELVGVLELLRNPNPALWSATALVCRNVVLILGDALWKVPGDTYESQLAAKSLVVKGEKEVNRLLAFIDHHHRCVSDDAAKPELEEMHELAITTYERGCKGKKSKVTRHTEAQGLVVDTFSLVSGLQQLTGLEPVTHIS